MERRVPGYKEALAFSGSKIVQQRIYSACFKIYNKAIKETDENESRAAKLFGLASNVLAAWGIKRLVSAKEGNPHTYDDVPHDLVAKSDILMAKSWIKVMQIVERTGDEYVVYHLISGFVEIYMRMRSELYPYEKFTSDGAHLNPDENGKYSKLELHFEELEAMYNTMMMVPVHARVIADLDSVAIMKAILNTIKRFASSLNNSGTYKLPIGDERHLIIWGLYEKIALAAMKAAKAFLLEPQRTWTILGDTTMAEEVQHFIVVVVGRCNLELTFVPLQLNGFAHHPYIPESYLKYCEALALFGLDILKYTIETIWRKWRCPHARIRSYSIYGVSIQRKIIKCVAFFKR